MNKRLIPNELTCAAVFAGAAAAASVILALASDASAVLSVRKKTGQLQLVSTSRHITQGAADLLDITCKDGALSGRSKVVKDDPYTIKAYNPKTNSLVEKTILPTATGELEWTLA